VAQVEQRVQQTVEQSFYSELGKAVTDWQAVNADPRWHAWLGEYDAIAGKPRQASLDEAHQGLDHVRVAALFNLFKSTLPPAAPPQKSGQSELARQVAPSKSSTANVAPAAAKRYTAQEYAYWTDHRRVHDTPKADLENMLIELESAVAEGRVKW